MSFARNYECSHRRGAAAGDNATMRVLYFAAELSLTRVPGFPSVHFFESPTKPARLGISRCAPASDHPKM